MKMKNIYLAVLLCGLIATSASAQQLPTYSQYLFNDYAYNPAVAGTRPYFDVKSGHRYQWVGLNDAPRTYTLSVHGPTKNQKMGLGAFLFTDHVGPTRRTGFQMSYAYHLNLTEDIRLSLSASAGMLEWKLDAHKINLYDPNDQVIVNGVMRAIVPDAKFGFLVYHKDWYGGAAAPNLLRSKLQFANAQNTGLSRLEDHYYIHGGYRYQINDDFLVEPAALIKFGLPAPVQFDIMGRVVWKDQVWLGGAYRTNDAASVMLGYLYRQNLMIGYSYDFTTTNLQNYSSGTHELMLGVRFVRASTFEMPED